MITDLITDPAMRALEISRDDVLKVFDTFRGVYIEREFTQPARGVEIPIPGGFKPEAVIVARVSPDTSALEICWDEFRVGFIKINMLARGKIALLVGKFVVPLSQRGG